MKTIKNNFRTTNYMLIACTICFAFCKKDKVTDPNNNGNNSPAIPTGTLMLHLHTYLDDNEVDLYNIAYTTNAGRNISLSLTQLYISDIQLVKLDGSSYNFSGKKLLKVQEAETYLVGNVPVGNYKSIKFKVGLDAATNALNPSASADSAILKKTEMWFGSTAQPDGYIFMNVQGAIDTSSDLSGTTVPFVYKIGTNANYKQVTMPDKNFSIIKDQVEYGHIIIDYNKLFSGISLNQSINLLITTASANISAPATTVANNIPLMFRYE